VLDILMSSLAHQQKTSHLKLVSLFENHLSFL